MFAPILKAASNFYGLISTAPINLAFILRAIWITARPTAPKPKTTIEEFDSILHVLITAPQPVATPQPTKAPKYWGILGLILAAEI